MGLEFGDDTSSEAACCESAATQTSAVNLSNLPALNSVARRSFVAVLNLCLIALSSGLAFLLRFEGSIPAPQASLFWRMLPWLLLVRAAAFVPFRLHEGLWRYTSIWDLRNILLGVWSSSLVFYLLVHQVFGFVEYSRSIFIIDSVLLICFMSGVRLSRRIYREVGRREGHRRVLIYGAGDAGELIVRDMKNTDGYEYEPIGFIDDDRKKTGQRIHGVPVLGTRADLRRIVDEYAPHEILIALPRGDAATMRAIVRALESFKVKITTLPSLREILGGKVTVSHIRTLAPEDLLGRAPVDLDPEPVRRLIRGRRVMVTGAGGSIGSELCRQVATFGPTNLVLVERYENSLFAIANDLDDRGFDVLVSPVVADVTDAVRIDSVLETYRPDIIFHAAAHKHVPLMEQNPCEAIKNNVMGTRVLAEAAERHGVARFILISTDKAVNPTSVMGATKRVAELIVQSLAPGSGTSFFAVRFGNVLASNGSVVPRFIDQIRAGGPVTITHPDMRRYFMLIQEAAELVLHAAASGDRGGQLYVLEMGEQIKLLDMARDLIRLSGYTPDDEIQITFVGLRPGEKLEEELIGTREVAEASAVGKVLRVRSRAAIDPLVLADQVASLERLALEGDIKAALAQLRTIVPEFVHASQPTPNREASAVREQTTPTRASYAVRRFGESCPACRSTDVCRSKAQSLTERVRRSLADATFMARSQKRLFRCRACGWRGWLVPMERLSVAIPPEAAPKLSSLDTIVTESAARSRRVFMPRDL